MNRQECLAGEWREAGYTDALKGYATDRLSSHAEACAKYGIDSNNTLYTEGYDEGLKEYCQPEVGFNRGRNKNDYRGICPVDLEPAFLQGYIKGLQRALFTLNHDYSDTRNDLRNARIRRLHAETSEHKHRIDQRIHQLEQELRDIRQNQRDLQTAISRWELRSI